MHSISVPINQDDCRKEIFEEPHKRPTIILVHGAFHTTFVWSHLIPHLEKVAYNMVAVQLPSAYVTPKTASSASIERDAAAIRAVVMNLFDEGKEVVIIAHSYGAVPSGIVAKGLSTAIRKTIPEKGGILGLVFIASPLIFGEPLVMAGDSLPGWINEDVETGIITCKDPLSIFYHDVHPDLASQAISNLGVQSGLILRQAARVPAWLPYPAPTTGLQTDLDPKLVREYDNRKVYVITEDDHALPRAVQEMMLDRFDAGFEVKKMPGSHSPMFARPEELSSLLDQIISKWISAGK